MLTLTHRYRIYPDAIQEQILIEWMEICRGALNYALREIKDWCLGRKCLVDRCSLEKEYILSPELKDLSVRVHHCPHCGYTTDRDVAAGQNIRNRGIALISTPGLGGKETACADDLPGTGENQSRQVSKPRKRVTRKPKK
jgi:transposase